MHEVATTLFPLEQTTYLNDFPKLFAPHDLLHTIALVDRRYKLMSKALGIETEELRKRHGEVGGGTVDKQVEQVLAQFPNAVRAV